MTDDLVVTVLFFARSRELVGAPELNVSLPAGATTRDLLARLLEQYPDLASIQETTIFALNQEYLEPGQEAGLRDRDEVAMIPPISGG
mmetsp:Transcript_36130/g.90777  ORF Transcript_36130/g.90777 Transcript_36130/m.90777 type:complete len:88 (+) Transcript_36130:142-405(+)